MAADKKVTVAVNGGIGFGSKLTPKQLMVLYDYLEEDTEIELTTFQQLYIEVSENKLNKVTEEFEKVGLNVYSVGRYVKSLRTCSFCKGSEEEGMPVAKQLNDIITGQEVPHTLRPAYTGCANACGEPLINDIGVIKQKDGYDLYVGGKANGMDAATAQLLKQSLPPEQLYEMVNKVLEIYREHGKKREHFSKFLKRYGLDNLKMDVETDTTKRK